VARINLWTIFSRHQPGRSATPRDSAEFWDRYAKRTISGPSPVITEVKITPRKRIIEPHKLKFKKVRPDQALAPEHQVVRDCLVAPLREEAMGLGIGAGQMAWG